MDSCKTKTKCNTYIRLDKLEESESSKSQIANLLGEVVSHIVYVLFVKKSFKHANTTHELTISCVTKSKFAFQNEEKKKKRRGRRTK